MNIPRICPMCGKLTHKELDVTVDQLLRYERGTELIQEVFPDLTADEREFIMSGYCDECMEKLFSFEEV